MWFAYYFFFRCSLDFFFKAWYTPNKQEKKIKRKKTQRGAERQRIYAGARAGFLLGSARIPADRSPLLASDAQSPPLSPPASPAPRPRSALPGGSYLGRRGSLSPGHAWEPRPALRPPPALPARPAALPSTGSPHWRRIFKRSFIATRELPSKIFNGPPRCQSKRGCRYTPHPPTLLTSHLLQGEV